MFNTKSMRSSAVFASLFLALCLVTGSACAADPLPALGADDSGLTVSGLSAGGFMAVQFHVAHSAQVRGAGVLAGGPYYCAQGSAARALSSCMSPNFLMPLPETKPLLAEVDKQVAARRIDPPDHLRQSRVWLFSGGRDSLVKSAVMDATQAFYLQWLPRTAIVYERLSGAGHAMIAPAVSPTRSCAATEPPFINRCDDFDAPGRLLAHLLGPLNPRAGAVAGNLLAFNQAEFATAGAALADVAYAYIPAACRQGGCRIHVAFHGCRQNAETLGETYVREAGYNPWAESNRLIVLYPQTSAAKAPNGCWDWWGYTGADYHLQSGKQISAVWAMVGRLMEKR